MNKKFDYKTFKFWDVVKEIDWREACDMHHRNEDVNEGISFAEERRVFYVAMTRTLNHLYMFVPKDVVKRSPYIKEICEIIANSTVDK